MKLFKEKILEETKFILMFFKISQLQVQGNKSQSARHDATCCYPARVIFKDFRFKGQSLLQGADYLDRDMSE